MTKIDVSVVVPLFNPAASLFDYLEEVQAALNPYSVEFILVSDNAALDLSLFQKKLSQSQRFESLKITWIGDIGNIGQHLTTIRGFGSANGRIVCSLDDDGQFDPGYLKLMIDNGFEAEFSKIVVYGLEGGSSRGSARNFFSRTFHDISTRLGLRSFKSSSFRVILGLDREVLESGLVHCNDVDSLLAKHNFKPLYVNVVDRVELDSMGSSYSLVSLVEHALRLLSTNSDRAMVILLIASVGLAIFGSAMLLFILIDYALSDHPLPGYTSLAALIIIFGSGQIMVMAFGFWMITAAIAQRSIKRRMLEDFRSDH